MAPDCMEQAGLEVLRCKEGEMADNKAQHEIISSNKDIDIRFYLSVDEGSYVGPHWHNSLEIIYMLEGNMLVKCGETENEVQAGDISIINSGDIHSFRSTKNKALVLQIPDLLLEKFIPEYSSIRFHADTHPSKKTEATKLEWLKKVCYDMYIVYEIQPEGYLLKFNSLLYDLLYMLLHSYSEKTAGKEASRSNKNREQIKKILRYLDRNHARHVTVRETADYFGYNADYLSRMVKKQIGFTVTEYLYEIRMDHIYRDLMNTGDYVNEIFLRHGCSNYKVAMRWFRERYQCTPTQARKNASDKMIIVKTQKLV